MSIRPSICFRSSLFLNQLTFVCISEFVSWIMTVARIGLKVKITGESSM